MHRLLPASVDSLPPHLPHMHLPPHPAPPPALPTPVIALGRHYGKLHFWRHLHFRRQHPSTYTACLLAVVTSLYFSPSLITVSCAASCLRGKAREKHSGRRRCCTVCHLLCLMDNELGGGIVVNTWTQLCLDYHKPFSNSGVWLGLPSSLSGLLSLPCHACCGWWANHF